DNNEGWVDEQDDMSEEEINKLKESIQPIRVLLIKVNLQTCICNQNSSTIVLPQWYRILENLWLDARVIPHDIHTRWNATYDMLEVAYQ
ncbi:hypothetical protein BGY98DRAFT_924319, partial [Russula aff. rugulosa BPL654]